VALCRANDPRGHRGWLDPIAQSQAFFLFCGGLVHNNNVLITLVLIGRLDGGTKAIDERAMAISTKLNDEMTRMRAEANTNRETLRILIEQKLDHSIGQQADASKVLGDELGGNFSPGRDPGFRFPHRGRPHPKAMRVGSRQKSLR
jgi:hypothetical protein